MDGWGKKAGVGKWVNRRIGMERDRSRVRDRVGKDK